MQNLLRFIFVNTYFVKMRVENILNYIIWTISEGLIPEKFPYTCISPILD